MDGHGVSRWVRDMRADDGSDFSDIVILKVCLSPNPGDGADPAEIPREPGSQL